MSVTIIERLDAGGRIEKVGAAIALNAASTHAPLKNSRKLRSFDSARVARFAG
jgi:hypothetical protein